MMSKKNCLFCVTVSVALACFYLTGCEKQKEEITQDNWLSKTLSTMPASQKIGQVFCLSVDPIRYFIEPIYMKNINLLIRKYKPGAIYLTQPRETIKLETLYDFNVNKLLTEINQMREQGDVPLLMGAEFENGAWFWDKRATRFSFSMGLGATESSDFAYREGKITGIEAKAQGINWIFAPVLNTPDYFAEQFKFRSYSDNVETITNLGLNFERGCRETGVGSCLKYFPVEKIDELSPADIETGILSPFKKCIDAGAFSVMGSPIIMNEDPAVSKVMESHKLIGDVLRNRLGFSGIIINTLIDDPATPASPQVQMKYILACLKAGYNMLILPETMETEIPVIDLMLFETNEGTLDMNIFDDSVKKLLTAKSKLKLHLFDTDIPVRGIAGIGLPEYHQTAKTISDTAVTLIKNEGNILPLDFKKQYIISISIVDEYSGYEATVYDNKFTQAHEYIKHMNVMGIPDKSIEREVMRRVKETNVVLLSFFIKPHQSRQLLAEESKKLIRNIMKINKHIVAVSFYSPYLINEFPEFQGFIATYSPSQESMDTAIEIIFGKRNPQGKLPSSLSNLYPAGSGFHYEHLIEENNPVK